MLGQQERRVKRAGRGPLHERGGAQALGVVVKASVRSVFCSNSWAFAEPVAGLALAERFTERVRRFLD